MKKLKTIVPFLLILLSIQSWSQAQIYDDYFEALIEYNFQGAQQIAQGFPENHRAVAETLCEVLYWHGQNPTIIEIPSKAIEDDISKILLLVTEGYQQLYQESYTTEPFKKFNAALAEATALKNKNLQKIALLGILEVYKFEISQSNNKYKVYTTRFEETATTRADMFHVKMNQLLFQLKDVSRQLYLDEAFIKSFEDILKTFNDSHPFWPKYLATSGPLLEALGNSSKAETYYFKAISLSADKPFLKHLVFRSYIRLSEIANRRKDYKSALEFINTSKNFVDSADSLKANYYLTLYKSKNEFGNEDYKLAYESLLTANRLGEQMDFRNNSIELANLNVKYETVEKEKQILVEQKQKTKNRNIAIGLGAGILAITLIAILAFKNARRKQRLAEQEKQLEIQKTTTLLKEQELVTINAMVDGQEKERQRLASDLHDSAGATLAAAKLQFNHLRSQKANLNNLEDIFETTASLLQQAYEEIRNMSHLKNSGVLAANGLLPALQKLTKNATLSGKMEFSLDHFGVDKRLDNFIEITIFRIIQELVTNIIKHAQASEAIISLTQHDDGLNIMVEDNGIGFQIENVTLDDSLGLSSIHKRVAHIGGTLAIDSTKNKGTTIIIDIPLKTTL